MHTSIAAALSALTVPHVLAAILASAVSSAAVAKDSSPGAGTASSDWPLLGGGRGSQQHSGLDQINDRNVADLGLLWYSDLPVKDGLVGNVLVMDGVAYQSAPHGRAIATDLATGKTRWAFAPEVNFTGYPFSSAWAAHSTRGVGIDASRVYTTSGCDVFGIDRSSGKQLWRQQVCDGTKGLGSHNAPRVGKGMIFVGSTNGETGTQRPFVAALDAQTGKERWRFHTVPGNPADGFESEAMQAASKTWPDKYWTETSGGAGAWEGMIYDDMNDLLIFGVGNPISPAYGASPGTEQAAERYSSVPLLYASSIVAVRARDGKYAWHYQLLAGDVIGLSDGTAHMVIAELPLPGGKRRVLMQAAKNGFFYVLDAKTGAYISANNYVPQENYKFDRATGKLTLRDEVRWWRGGRGFLMPAGFGAHTWTLMSFNPRTGLVYIPAYIYPAAEMPGAESIKIPEKYRRRAQLIAWDPIKQQERWRIEQPQTVNGGVLTTAGNLLLQGRPDGQVIAYAADTGKQLWSYNTHAIVLGAPSTVTVQGRQLILIPSGDGTATPTVRSAPDISTTAATMMAPSRLLAFGLGGKVELHAAPPKIFPRPALARFPKELAEQGAKLFSANACAHCHGGPSFAISGHGTVPDLHMTKRATFDALTAVLRDGALAANGMPGFPELSDDDIERLKAYIINKSWDDYETQDGRK